MARKLTPKQQAFVAEYLVDLNATAAYRRAGYKARGNSAEVNAHRLLRNTKVAEAVAGAMKDRSKRTEVTADMVVTELAKLGFSTMRDVADWSKERVSFKPSEDLSEEAAACVKDISSTREIRRDKYGEEIETLNLKISLHDKKGSLKLLGDHLGLFDSSGGDIGQLADTFLAGAQTVKDMEVADLSEE